MPASTYPDVMIGGVIFAATSTSWIATAVKKLVGVDESAAMDALPEATL